MGRVSSRFRTSCPGRETRFTFDAQGHQLSRTLPLGVASFGSGLSGAGALRDYAGQPGRFTEGFWYNDAGQQTLHVSFEGVVTAFLYDSFGRVSQKRFFDTLAQYANGQGAPTEVTAYQCDALGRQTSVVRDLRDRTSGAVTSSRTETTGFDSAGRLTVVTSPEGTIHYVFDTVTGQHTETWTGSGTNATTATTDTVYVYDTLGRLDAVQVRRRNGQAVDVDPNTAGAQPEETGS